MHGVRCLCVIRLARDQAAPQHQDAAQHPAVSERRKRCPGKMSLIPIVPREQLWAFTENVVTCCRVESARERHDTCYLPLRWKPCLNTSLIRYFYQSDKMCDDPPASLGTFDWPG